MTQRIAIFGFDYSTVMARPWADTGYLCYCVDLQHKCTHVAVSGARWFRDKGLGGLILSLQLFDAAVKIAEWAGAPYLIENPVSVVSTYWRKPDYSFDPCDYGDPWTKKTCLWTGGGFVMPEKRRVAATEVGKIHRVPPGPDRANIRSETAPGFASAVFEANSVAAALAAI